MNGMVSLHGFAKVYSNVETDREALRDYLN